MEASANLPVFPCFLAGAWDLIAEINLMHGLLIDGTVGSVFTPK